MKHINNQMKIAIYLRKSRAEELSDSVEDTLKRHKDTLISFAKTQNLTIQAIYEEVVSGENLYVRTEMLRLLSDVEQGMYDAVLCMDIDRLGRGAMSQQGIILETFKTAATKIITPRKVYDLNDELDEEYTEFQTLFARRELKTINRRMRQGIEKTVQDGGYIANAPYGYVKCQRGKLPSLEPVEHEANFIRMIFDMYVNKGVGCQTIAYRINELGAVPRRGTAFNRTTIMKIIKNDVYIGKVTWNRAKHIKPKTTIERTRRVPNDKDKWMVVDGIHPPIVDINTFERAQHIANGRYHPPFNKGILVNSLAGLVVCSHCGNKMQLRTYTNGSPAHILCTKKGCIKATQYRYVEASTISAIRDKLNELEVAQAAAKVQKTDDYASIIAKFTREIEQATAQRDKLHDLLEQGVYTIDTFVERNRTLESKLGKLNENKAEWESKLESSKLRNTQAIIDRIKNVLQAYETADSNHKNFLLKEIVECIYYFKQPEWKSDQFMLQMKMKDID